MRKILGILICVLLGAVLAAGGMTYLRMKTQPKVDAKGLMERLEESSELTVEKNYYTGIAKFSEGSVPLITRNSFSMKYEAEINAGFRLEEVTIDVTDTAVTVTVPPAEILSINIDPDSLEFYDNKTSLFKTDRKEATKQALQIAQKDAEVNATKKGLLEVADKRAEVIFKGILEGGVGSREIIVVQKGAAPAADETAEPEEDTSAEDAAEPETAEGSENTEG